MRYGCANNENEDKMQIAGEVNVPFALYFVSFFGSRIN